VAFGRDVIDIDDLLSAKREDVERLADYLGVRVSPVDDHQELALRVIGMMWRIRAKA
jgi:hypothetical protein